MFCIVLVLWGNSLFLTTITQFSKILILFHFTYYFTLENLLFLLNLLEWHLFVKPYRFQVCGSITHHLHTASCAQSQVSFCYHLSPLCLFHTPHQTHYLTSENLFMTLILLVKRLSCWNFCSSWLLTLCVAFRLNVNWPLLKSKFLMK